MERKGGVKRLRHGGIGLTTTRHWHPICGIVSFGVSAERAEGTQTSLPRNDEMEVDHGNRKTTRGGAAEHQEGAGRVEVDVAHRARPAPAAGAGTAEAGHQGWGRVLP